MTEVLPGAESWSHDAGPDAPGVLVCHGFTGNPSSMRPLAESLAAAGFTVELPRWPGHGTTIEDMLTTTWDDWSSAAEVAYADLAARCKRVVVAGLSMGGTLATWLATRHAEISGLVLVNPAVEPLADSFVDVLKGILETGTTIAPGIASDIAKPGVVESAYPGTPIEPLLTLIAANNAMAASLAEIRCPILLLTSRNDHVVPNTAGDYLTDRVSGPVERVWMERSFHVATLDYDKEDIEQRAVEFARKVTTA